MKTEAGSLMSKLVLFGALSRTPHGVMELAVPSLAALLWLGHIPDFGLIALGLLTAFAGYTSVYAVNDLVDYRVDRERIRQGGFQDTEIAVEKGIRHPVAQGVLSLKSGLLWAGLWGLAALAGAWGLNPVCAWIFMIGAFLEILYCLMLKVSPMRTFVHGFVKTSGAVAAVFAVAESPSIWFLLALFFWLYFWEVGGQNIPADWHDLEEDKILNAKTIPLTYGTGVAGQVVLASLSITVFLSLVLGLVAPARLSPVTLLLMLLAGGFLLIWPARRLALIGGRAQAGALFSRATFYPPVVFALVLVDILWR